MKPKLFTLLLAVAASIGTMFASDTQVNGIWYNFNSTNKTAEVTYHGSSYYTYSNEYAGIVTIPASVTYWGTTYSVTSIGKGAFQDCSTLTSVTIPNSVTSIGNSAFSGCSGLTSVRIPNNVTSIGEKVFSGCSGLTSVTIPNSVTSIGGFAFSGCSGLTSVTIPNSVTSIGFGAFRNCTSLATITIPNSVTSIGGSAFEGCSSLPIENNIRYAGSYLVEAVNKTLSSYTIKSGTKWIGSSAFQKCSSLNSITIPSSVKVIQFYAFNCCTGLTSVTIPSSVKVIQSHAFAYCTGLTSVTIPNSVTDIGDEAFRGCISLSSVTIPDSITTINAMTFAGCSGLTSVTIPNSVTSIGDNAFQDCTGLTSVTIPNSVTSIGSNAFELVRNIVYTGSSAWSTYGALSLNGFVDGYMVYKDATKTELLGCSSAVNGKVIIPSSVTNIGNNAFYDCSGLTSVTIPNSVTSIGDGAFCYCSGLTSVTIPNSVTSIANYAFSGCNGLISVTCEATAPPTLGGSSVFSSVDKSIPVYVPGESVDLYKAADRWKEFTNILPIEETPAPCILASGTCGTQGDNLIWELSCDSLLTISGTGAMADYSSGSAPWYTNRTSITSIIINNGVTSIGNYAFQNCSSLTSVTIPNSVTSIGNNAFFGCTGLTKVNITDIAAWCNIAFGNGTSNPLYNAKHLFVNDIEVTELVIPNGVTSIGQYAFYYCSSLTSVTIPNSVTSIGYAAFYDCSGLTSVTIPNSVTSIGDFAFANCSSLTSISVATNNQNYSSKDGVLFNKQQTTLIQCPCGMQGEYVIPNSVTSIGEYAFYGCSSLTSVKIPSSVTSIGEQAFYGCSSLTSVTIPNSVTSIANYAFSGCNGLISVTCEATAPPTLGGSSVFSSVDKSIPVYVPGESVDLYKAADRWKEFTNILPIEETPAPCILASGTCGTQGDNLIWELSCDSLLTISGTGAMADYSSGSAPWYTNRTSITSIIINNGVTSIGIYAFQNCSSLTSVTIPNSVTSIGRYAFGNCRGLTSVTIPNSVTSIGNDAFFGCSGLTKVNITDIAAWCNIAFGNGISNPLYNAKHLFVNDIEVTELVIPNGVTSIGQYAFYYCSGLTSVTIPNSVTSIGSNAFSGCSGLAKVNITDIAAWCNIAFGGTANPLYYAKHLSVNDVEVTDLVIPNGVTSIGQYAFSNCSSLTSVTIPNSVTSIGDYAFSGCSSLAKVNITDIAAWCNIAFGGSSANPLSYAKHLFVNDIEVTELTIPNSVTSIGQYAFYNCSGLTSVTIPNSVTSIGNNAFSGCNGLTSVTIPNSVTSIGFGAFRNCTSLATITIPNSVTSIGGSAFYGCSSLTSVTIPNSVTSIGNRAFENCSSLTDIYVCGDLERFQQLLNNDDRIKVGMPYSITINAEHGNVSYPQTMCDDMLLNATPDYGYHFVKWSDGNTDNPRTIELTCDTIFTALFEHNQCTLSLQCDENQGTVEGAGVFDYLAEVQISATPAYGYHFSSWSDGNTANPRTITITKDIALTANFAPNKYTLNVSCNAEQGSVKGSGSYNYLSNRTIEAIPNYGYHFAQWNDGNTDNPRTFELRQDTAFVAIFAVDKYGTCGDNLQLTWRYDTGSQTLTISGEGDLTTNMRYGVEAVKEMKELVIEDGVGVIGNEAFANIKTLNTITLGKDVRKLQERVFYNCYNLTAIYNYRKTPASATGNTFEEVDKYACTIYVLAGSEEMFRSATGWKDFYSILAIGATETTVTDNKARVEPSDNSATVTWPVSNEAASYTIDITKDGVVFCRLTFNANGQLTGIAFAPGRDGQSMAQAAVMTANGLQFTVTGLTSNTRYGYSITATDAENTEVASYTGTFTTTGEIATGIDAQQSDLAPRKFIRDGQVLILRDGKTYTIQGVEVK